MGVPSGSFVLFCSITTKTNTQSLGGVGGVHLIWSGLLFSSVCYIVVKAMSCQTGISRWPILHDSHSSWWKRMLVEVAGGALASWGSSWTTCNRPGTLLTPWLRNQMGSGVTVSMLLTAQGWLAWSTGRKWIWLLVCWIYNIALQYLNIHFDFRTIHHNSQQVARCWFLFSSVCGLLGISHSPENQRQLVKHP